MTYKTREKRKSEKLHEYLLSSN